MAAGPGRDRRRRPDPRPRYRGVGPRAWPAAPLASRQRVEVTVRVEGADGRPSAWSAPLDRRGRAAPGRGLVGAGGLSGGPARGHGAGPSAVHPAGGGRPGSPVRHRPRGVRGGDQRPAGGRRGAGPGVDQLPPPPPVPDLRRHRPGDRGGERAGGDPGRRLVPGSIGVRRWSGGPVRRPPRPDRPARGRDRRRRGPPGGDRRGLEGLAGSDDPHQHLRRRGPRPEAGARGLVVSGLRRHLVAAESGCSTTT